MQNKNIFIGIDLSFNSTGIVIYNQHENKLQFHRVAYRDQDKKINNIHNVNTIKYSMPTNVITTDICSMEDTYTFEQYEATLKSMICVKTVSNIVGKYIKNFKCEEYIIHLNIEGFIGNTPNFNTITGLIMLQGMLRSTMIQLFMNQHFEFKMKITSPPTLKKFFTGNGEAEKLDMIYAFFRYYEGKKLINTFINNLEINDVVDAFALMAMSVATSFGLIEIKKKVKKKRKTGGVVRSGITIQKRKLSDIFNVGEKTINHILPVTT